MPDSYTVEHPSELLDFLLACHPGAKRTRVRQWLKYGAIQVNGQTVARSTHRVRTGDAVSIRAKRETRAVGLLPPGMNILFEDGALIVIEKPENLLSTASAKERSNTAYAVLTDYVRRRHPRSSGRVWIVHRLDRETSGLMVFAKTEAAKRTLQGQWDTTDKRYLAVVEGRLPADHGVLRSHLNESNPFKVYSAPRGAGTRHAVTRYRVVKRTSTSALVELAPETGRRHQLRVHLADTGCPIVGDQKYEARTNPALRLALHATFLQFKHPLSGDVLRFESPLPEALARLL